MTKAKHESLIHLFDRLSVQSMLDMKQNYHEVSIDVLDDMNSKCYTSFEVYALDVFVGVCFVYDADDVYNLLFYTTADFAKLKDESKYDIKEHLKLLKGKDINSIIYSGANQVLGVLYSVGFLPIKKVKNYKILRLTNE